MKNTDDMLMWTQYIEKALYAYKYETIKIEELKVRIITAINIIKEDMEKEPQD